MTPDPGIYEDVPEQEYFSWDAASKSTMWRLNDVLEVAHNYDEWKRIFELDYYKDAFSLGSFVDDILSYGDAPEDKYREGPTKTRGKAFKEEQSRFNGILLTPDEIDKGQAMAESARLHPLASEIYSGIGKNQVSIVWVDEDTGVTCKARIDRITGLKDPVSGDEFSTYVDLKTCRNIDRFRFDAIDYGYHIQHAHYRAGFEALDKLAGRTPIYRRFIFLVIESSQYASTGRHRIRPFEFDECDMHKAEQGRASLLRLYKMFKDGQHPGARQFVRSLYIPDSESSKYGVEL